MKPYQQVAIVECNEPLIAIPTGSFAFVSPHAYQKLGAPYGDKSPFYLRQGVLDRLLVAQQTLQQTHPGWQIQIFDAYRPVAVQQFMVDYTFSQLAQAAGQNPDTLTETQTQALLQTVYQFWAVPNVDPKMPPPHSTGAAIDITLVNATGAEIDMGSQIDEISDRSYKQPQPLRTSLSSTPPTAKPGDDDRRLQTSLERMVALFLRRPDLGMARPPARRGSDRQVWQNLAT
jgi:zinc D-Ala-D-Ala dipeptidase